MAKIKLSIIFESGALTLRDRETQTVGGYYDGSWTTDRHRTLDLRKREVAEAHAVRMRERCTGGPRPTSSNFFLRRDTGFILDVRQRSSNQVLWPTKSASSLRVVSRATNRNIGTSRKNEKARSGSAAAIEWDVAIQPTIAGADAVNALPKVNAEPTAVPRIWVGNSSVAGWLMQVRSRRPGWWPKQTT
jgi:hypothetical protein